LLLRVIVGAVLAFATPSVTLSWIPSATPKTKGQWVRCGVAHLGPYTKYSRNLGAKVRSATLKVAAGVPLFCVVTAVSSNGIESGASNEVSFIP
jgi:hypothetical protein